MLIARSTILCLSLTVIGCGSGSTSSVSSQASAPAGDQMLRLSEAFLNRTMSTDVFEESNTRQRRQGVTTTGTSVQAGRTSIELQNSSEAGAIAVRYVATTNGKTTNRKCNVRFFTNSITSTNSAMTVYLQPKRVSYSQAKTNAATRMTISGACVPRKLGWRVKKMFADRKISQQSCRIRETIRRCVAKVTNVAFAKKVKASMGDSALQEMVDNSSDGRFVSNGDYLYLVSPKSAVEGERPVLEGRSDVAIYAHEDVINKRATALLANQELTKDELGRKLRTLLFFFKAPASEESIKITFPEEDPFTVRFVDDQLTITMTGEVFETEETIEEIPMVLSATYAVGEVDGRTALVREEFSALPPGVESKKARMPFETKVLHTMLEDMIDNIYPPSFDLARMQMAGARADEPAKLGLSRLDVQEKWFIGAWKLEE